MKFGKKFQEQQIPEWKLMYLDYKHLKHLIKVNKLNLHWEPEFLVALKEESDNVLEFYQNMLTKFMARNALLHTQIVQLHKNFNDSKRNVIVKAYQEHYRGLQLLKRYIQLNELALHKISKKFEKASHVKLVRFRFDSRILNFLTHQTEHVFITEFADGDRKKGMKMIRIIEEKLYNFGVVFRSGMWVGLTITFLIAILTLYGFLKNSNPDLENELYVFKVILFPIILLLCISLNLRIWSLQRINWRFIFEISAQPRLHLTKWEFTEISLILLFLWELAVLSLLIQVYYKIALRWITTIILVGVILIWLLFPLNIFYQQSRFWFVQSLLRCICAPFFHVKFCDYWIADQLVSLSEFLFEIQFAFCFYPVDQGFCSRIQSFGIPMLNVIPFWIRMMQTLRRFHETGDRLHIVNTMKYLISGLAVILAFVDTLLVESLGVWNFLKIYWIVFNTIASLHRFVWDVYVDWGLFRKRTKHILLRKTLMFHPMWYYVSIILNFVIRFLWIALLVINITVYLDTTLRFWITLMVGAIEIFRRFIWNVFRLENEHLYNCENFRVVREIPLPFEVTTDEELLS